MTKQQTINRDSASAVILQIPLEMLTISDLNPRKAVSEAHIESLASSIERFGLIHNLAGLMDGDGKVGICLTWKGQGSLLGVKYDAVGLGETYPCGAVQPVSKGNMTP